MARDSQPNSPNSAPHSSFHVWFLTFVCLLLLVLALAAAARLPYYVATVDYVRLIGVVVFNLLVLIGLADNIHSHFLVWQNHNASSNAQAKMAAQN